jgi:hypothetical protein
LRNYKSDLKSKLLHLYSTFSRKVKIIEKPSHTNIENLLSKDMILKIKNHLKEDYDLFGQAIALEK